MMARNAQHIHARVPVVAQRRRSITTIEMSKAFDVQTRQTNGCRHLADTSGKIAHLDEPANGASVVHVSGPGGSKGMPIVVSSQIHAQVPVEMLYDDYRAHSVRLYEHSRLQIKQPVETSVGLTTNSFHSASMRSQRDARAVVQWLFYGGFNRFNSFGEDACRCCSGNGRVIGVPFLLWERFLQRGSACSPCSHVVHVRM